MAYDEGLAQRIRTALESDTRDPDDCREITMFGGLGSLARLHDHLDVHHSSGCVGLAPAPGSSRRRTDGAREVGVAQVRDRLCLRPRSGWRRLSLRAR
jgi:hypothetical protein